MSEKVAVAEHPTMEALLAFASDDSEEEAAGPVAVHIVGCAECAGTIERYRLVRDVMRESEALQPSPASVSRAKALFASRARPAPTPEPDLLAPLRRIVATLVFDSGRGMALAGFRGSGDHHLTYVAEDVQVDLRLEPPPDRGGAWRVQGQVDADWSTSGAPVEMVVAGGDEAVARAVTDELGMFALTAPVGHYDIVVRLSTAVHVLPGVELG